MSDEPRLTVNGVDLSAFVKDIKIDVSRSNDYHDAFLPGLKNVGPITITGYFDDPTTYVCGVCGQTTARLASGDPVLQHSTMRSVPVCGDCLVPLIEQGVVTTD